MLYLKNKITENDLFNFIFFRDSLDEEKKKIIQQEETFKDSINFYAKMRSSLSKGLSFDARKKIAELIPSYRIINKIELYPVEQLPDLCKESTRKSKTPELKRNSLSLSNDDRSFLARIICEGSVCQMFVFSSDNVIIKNFDVTIYPKGKKYHFEDNTKPVDIKDKPAVEKMIMTLQ